jgi:nicotinate phosphoribosyltransferase
MWEVPLMACISELYFKFKDIPDYIETNIPRWKEKFAKFSDLKIRVSEFGTRRRKSKMVQKSAIKTFIETAPSVIVGTSNVMFSRIFNIPAHGTQAHEWYMFHAVKYGVQMANRIGLGRWVDVYHGALGTALSDTYTSGVFYRDFDLFYSKLFDGVRQDSGNPITFAEKSIEHYRKMNILLPNGFIPKNITFSDSIDNHEKIKSIEDTVSNKILSSYGIGTWITFDIINLEGIKINHINMVIKMSAAMPDEKIGWKKCVKLSDDVGKITGDKKTAEFYKLELGI